MCLAGPEDLSKAKNITVKVIHEKHPSFTLKNTFKITNGNIVDIHINGETMLLNGEYRLIISYTKHNPALDLADESYTIDTMVFAIVPYSDLCGGKNDSPWLEISGNVYI